MVDQVNGTGKKKMTKAAQRAREQELVDVTLKDNKLIMISKTEPVTRSFAVPLVEVGSIFRDIYGPTDLSTLSFDTVSPAQSNRKRRKEDIEISPTNSSASSLMSESKRIKVDSPENLFLDNVSDIHKSLPVPDHASGGETKREEEQNVWDWNYWETL